MQDKFLIVGSGGREAAFAIKLIKDCILYAVITHENPSIVDCVKRSGGKYLLGDTNDPKIITAFAIKHQVDYVFVSADDPLANGVVDELLNNNIKAIGGTKDATRIEWDKIYSINMMQKVCPEFTPFYRIASNEQEVVESINDFKNKKIEVVVKPQGLTGGKGVKVMPEHLKSYQECIDYALEILDKDIDEKVLLVEKLHGIEFTIMGLTDGEHLVMAPASYDYPFRFKNDLGVGTGGMGCFTSNQKILPFMNQKDWDDCKIIMQRIIDAMRSDKLLFNGVLNGGFFKTKDGIKFMEFNGRFGDPEGLNILSILQGSFKNLLKHLYHKTLSEDKIQFINKASVIKYLVAKEYPKPSTKPIEFEIDVQKVNLLDVDIFFATCVKNGDGRYQTLKTSRVVAFGALRNTINEASDVINQAITECVSGNLDYRDDIGSLDNLQKLSDIKQNL